MEAQARHMEIGDPTTSTPAELKESGFMHEARIGLMQSPTTPWEAEQRKYIFEMASEMGYKVITKKEYRELQRLMSQPQNHKHVKSGRKPARLKRDFAKTMKKKEKAPAGIFGPISIPKTQKYKVIKPYGTLKVGRILNMPTNVDTSSLVRRGIIKKRGKPLAIPKIKAPPITAIVLGTPKRKVKRKKRKRNHSRRVGKTPRRLKKLVKNGKKSFSFPDHIWKVRKL